MFLTPEDFNEFPYIIPNASEKGQLQPFINREEEKVLRRLLGNVTYNALASGYEDVQIWMDLVAPANYGDNDEYYWVGLKEALKPYMCAIWLQKNHDQYDDGGVSYAKNENSERVDPAVKIVGWYNEYVNLVGYKKCTANTLYGFLMANKDVYTSLVWGNPKYMNTFNL